MDTCERHASTRRFHLVPSRAVGFVVGLLTVSQIVVAAPGVFLRCFPWRVRGPRERVRRSRLGLPVLEWCRRLVPVALTVECRRRPGVLSRLGLMRPSGAVVVFPSVNLLRLRLSRAGEGAAVRQARRLWPPRVGAVAMVPVRRCSARWCSRVRYLMLGAVE